MVSTAVTTACVLFVPGLFEYFIFFIHCTYHHNIFVRQRSSTMAL